MAEVAAKDAMWDWNRDRPDSKYKRKAMVVNTVKKERPEIPTKKTS
jgi:hypothetical protein